MDITDPHRYLALHEGGKTIRLLAGLKLEVKGKEVSLEGNGKGIFEYHSETPLTYQEYLIIYPSGFKGHDPYAFLPTFSKEDQALFSKGNHLKIDEVMGGRICEHQGVMGVKFAVWAPHAKNVSLIADFNGWNIDANPMRKLGDSGVWELFVPALKEGERYKFAIETLEGVIKRKADPYGYQGEMRPDTASVVTQIDRHVWNDHEWMEKREKGLNRPLNIYEVHLGSWKKEGREFLNYREIASLLIEYVKKLGYTHIELMPVMGHPFDESWGYQVTGFYAVSRRYGTVEDFQYFIDLFHQNGIGVILDWVPGHFPTDEHSIVRFDGTYLYEHEDPKRGFHPQWNTHIFNFGRSEVRNFLLGSALFYLNKMHIDGLRVDAVSSMIYLDFERGEGEWVPNEEGGNENKEAIYFLQTLNQTVKDLFPSALMIAEESHGFPGVTDPKGLGFDLRWDLGWMNDALRYIQTPYEHRGSAHHLIVHEMTYYYDEKHLLPLSHDEVVHEKKSLLSKMPGNEWEKFANFRLFLSYMMCHPGKKLLFMGGEIGQWHEWNCKEELHWDVLAMPFHHELQFFVSELNTFYKRYPALYEEDFSKDGFEWVEHRDSMHSVFSYLRKSKGETLLCIHHFSPEELHHYLLPIKQKKMAKEVFSTDLKEYGGYGIMKGDVAIDKDGMRLTLPPLSTVIFQL
ncbi:MAG: 1,4-alpha-glucan branching protein GlgB [Chlamydiia bacterium]|nr:1,4-alpha-glucan branching protein GlgB [Chlamydiia bacterium]